MKMLEDRIRKDGIVREGNVLKVDSFINHQMDIPLFREMAKEWKRLFDGKPINKVLTIEASGIGIAAVVASEFNVPVVFAKKSMSINLDYDNYETKIQSFTHKKIYNVIVSKKFLTPEDHVLIIDDFLANGCALLGLLELTEKAGATVEGIGIAVEKGFQQGGDLIRSKRSTEKRIKESFTVPTLNAAAGDLSLVLPKRILDGIIEMIYALDKVAPGTANDDTLLYGVEVKFYNMEVALDEHLETPYKGLYVIGDGSGITHSLSHASASGVHVARQISKQ